MPGGFSFGGAATGSGGGGGGGGGSGSRQQPTYVWDLLPYSRRGVGFAASGSRSGSQQQDSQHQHQHQQFHDIGSSLAEPGASGLSTEAQTQQHQQHQQQQQQPPQPRPLTVSEATLLEQLYRRKVRESGERYELVAAFRLRSGRVHAYHVYRTRLPFQLTERRKKLLRDYYSQGCQDVALYVNQAEFEHYMPLGGSFKKSTGQSADSRRVTQTRSVNGLKAFLGLS